MRDRVIERVAVINKILDIGCGNGNLAIKLAKRHSNCNIIGLDYWGKEWEYGAAICERNARLENVSNINFVQGSASKLPFEDASFDSIVSCLTFHEVRDVKEKEDCLKEAIRVLKLNGHFVFLDLFDDPKFYPVQSKYKQVIAHYGGLITEDKAIHEVLDLPFPLNDKKSLKYARIIITTILAIGKINSRFFFLGSAANGAVMDRRGVGNFREKFAAVEVDYFHFPLQYHSKMTDCHSESVPRTTYLGIVREKLTKFSSSKERTRSI